MANWMANGSPMDYSRLADAVTPGKAPLLAEEGWRAAPGWWETPHPSSLIPRPVMAHDAPWLSLLAPLPPEGGEWHQETRADPVLAGWTQVSLVLGDGPTGMRILTAMFDPAGRPGMVSDLVARDGGLRQETAGGRIEPDGRMRGTYWLTEGDRHTPRAVTAEEEEGLKRLAAALKERCEPPARTAF